MGNNYGGKGFVKNNGRNTNQVKSPATETSKQVKTVVDFAEDAIKNLKVNCKCKLNTDIIKKHYQ